LSDNIAVQETLHRNVCDYTEEEPVMPETYQIALVGDYNLSVTAHQAIPLALEIAANLTGCRVDHTWVGTGELAAEGAGRLSAFDGVWCVPGSPYASEQGALNAIRFAREQGRPFLGTCGGYQHALVEYARNVLGYEKAANSELDSATEMPLVAPLACALVERSGEILLLAGSRITGIYGQERIVEEYRCSFGYNPRYKNLFDSSSLHISGRDADGEPRAIELTDHPFFIGTAFQPERSALTGRSHPLISAFVNAIIAARNGARPQSWRIVCVKRKTIFAPQPHLHIAGVGTGDAAVWADIRWTLHQALAALKKGDRFYILDEQNDQELEVVRIICPMCGEPILGEPGAGTSRLDEMRACKYPSDMDVNFSDS